LPTDYKNVAKSKPPASGSAQKRLAAERAAAARQRIQAAQRRRQLLTVAGAVGVVIVIVAVLIVVKVVGGGGTHLKSGTKTVQAAESVSTRVASVPTSVFDQIGVGTAQALPKKTSGSALTSAGLPRVLYVGAEWCPYCAAERWALAAAMARFGTFSGLGQTSSSPTDVYPNTATLSFHGASYSSKYLAFTGKELQSNQVVKNKYTTLDTLSAADQALYDKTGGFPYANLDGKWIINSAQYNPATLKGLDQQQIAKALSVPSSAVAKAVDGSANVITADLCTLTKGAPAAVCSSAGVKAAATAIASNGG
jgi:hypothetical protein